MCLQCMCSLVLLDLCVDTKNVILDLYTIKDVILYLNDKKNDLLNDKGGNNNNCQILTLCSCKCSKLELYTSDLRL